MQFVRLYYLALLIVSASASPITVQDYTAGAVQSLFFNYYRAFSKAVASWPGSAHLPEVKHTPKAILITCMDVRLMPEEALGLKANEVNVLRNAGGRVKSLIPSIVVSQKSLGSSEITGAFAVTAVSLHRDKNATYDYQYCGITVLHHTDCGMNVQEQVLQDEIRAKVDPQYKHLVNQLTYDAFPDLKQSLLDDYKILHDNPLIDTGNVRLGIWNVTTNRIHEVKLPQ